MKYNTFSLVPNFNENIFSDRFNQIDKVFSRLTGNKPLSEFPNYNLIRNNSNNEYDLVLSLPGYKREEINITTKENSITITGKIKEKEKEKENIKYLNKGIEKKFFSINFNLENKIKIKNANLNLGLLSIKFKYDIPEKEKSKKIFITENEKI